MPEVTNSAATPDPPDVAVVSHNVVSLYDQPDTSAPLASQLVLGVRVQILARAVDADGGGEMARVVGEDRYEGWMRARYLAAPQDYADNPRTTIASLIADVYTSPSAESQPLTKLTVATPVALARHAADRDFTPILLPSGVTGYTHRGNLSSSYQSEVGPGALEALPSQALLTELRAQVIPRLLGLTVDSALRMVGTPYLWGGTTPFGIDCSGLTQLCYKIAGIQLLRDAWMQMADRRFTALEEEVAMEDAAFTPGDLLFFHSRSTNAQGRIAHVALAVGDGSFVHAAGQGRGVMVTPCDDPEWVAIYAGARRLSPDADFSVQTA